MDVIDMHVHFGTPKDENSGCFWSEKFEKTPAYFFMKITSGSLFKKITPDKILAKLLKVINKTKFVDKCVLLAMDKVYNESGDPVPGETHLYVPNSYIVKLSGENDRILFGASVHPYRKDWQNELEYCLKNGACLCKWIPSSQQINPASNICIPFYKKLAEYKLPLLMHSGPEYAIPTSNSSFDEKNNPRYLETALNLGVTVIVAHCSLPYFGKLDTNYLDDLEEFYKLFQRLDDNHWNLYADVSALTTPLRNVFIKDVLEKIPQERLLLGSDYPIPASELSYKQSKNIFKWIKLFFEACSIKNPLDKNYYLIKEMGFRDPVFTNASVLFNKIIRPH